LISRLAADEEVKKDTKTPVATKVSESSATSAKKKVTVTRYEDQEGDVTDGICGAGTDEDYQARYAALLEKMEKAEKNYWRVAKFNPSRPAGFNQKGKGGKKEDKDDDE
jgi:hypothetical protein